MIPPPLGPTHPAVGGVRWAIPSQTTCSAFQQHEAQSSSPPLSVVVRRRRGRVQEVVG